MTIETNTDLIHDYMYDRLNDSNNSNDGRNVEYVQKGRKEEMVRNIWIRKEQKATGVSKEKVQRQPLRTIWSTILVKTTHVSRQNGRVP